MYVLIFIYVMCVNYVHMYSTIMYTHVQNITCKTPIHEASHTGGGTYTYVHVPGTYVARK